MAPSSSSRPAGGEQGSSRTGRSTSSTTRGGLASFSAEDPADRTALENASAGDTSATTSGGAGSGAGASSGAAKRTGRGPRRIRLTLARLDPFSVMKLFFLLALGLGIATIVCTALLWGVVDAIGLWDKLDKLTADLNSGKPLPITQYLDFSKVVSYAVVVAFVNLVVITALGTLFAFLYNIVANLLGGLKMTFTDE